VTHFIEHYGLWVVFVVVMVEVAGFPFVPGETALIAAAVLASQGHGSIVWTIVLAIAAAVVGASAAYVVGRRWGRGLLRRWPLLERLTRTPIERSDHFFRRHGAKAVVLARFLPIVRATLGWMAGVGRMPLPRFLAANVAGAVAWGIGIGLLAFYVGGAVLTTIQRYGAYAIAAVAVLFIVGWVLLRRAENRL
jgi:membrane protein DedA with SNARE-associated domain